MAEPQTATCQPELAHGLPCHRLSLPCGDQLLVAEQGAHVLSWVSQGRERLYLSPRNAFDGHTPIRGGVPVCFPQFNQRGNLPKHGFFRQVAWQVGDCQRHADSARLSLRLSDNAHTRTLWPKAFVAALHLDLSPGSLQLSLEVHNTDTQDLRFTGALHTYFAVDAIAQTRLTGLSGQAEWDAVADVHGLAASELRFDAEFDRVYAASPTAMRLQDGANALHITQSPSWANTVVWNPGAAKCATLSDMPANGFEHMLCVEAAQVFEPVQVAAGQSWQGWQRLQVL